MSRAIALQMEQRQHELLHDTCASSVAHAKEQHDEPALASFERGFEDWCQGNLRWSAECPCSNATLLANDAELALPPHRCPFAPGVRSARFAPPTRADEAATARKAALTGSLV